MVKKTDLSTARAVRGDATQPGAFQNMPFRLTPQRMMILRLLREDTSHPNAEDIFRRVRAEYPGVSLKTVYNTLDLLNEKNMIQELVIEPRKKRYCPDPAPHHHFLCTSCKKVVDIFQDIPVRIEKKLLKGFRIDNNQIVFRGICADCHVDASKPKYETRR